MAGVISPSGPAMLSNVEDLMKRFLRVNLPMAWDSKRIDMFRSFYSFPGVVLGV
jgi:hypothetical protein